MTAESGRYDIAIVGSGIVGLATAFRLLQAQPGARLIIIEKEHGLGRHQTAHSSGVLHAGLYYAPGSLKAALCREGKAEMEAFAEEHGIPFRRCGKLVVATTEREIDALLALKQRAVSNAVPGLEEVGPERIEELEPHAVAIRGLYSPTTGVIDYGSVAAALAEEIRSREGTFVTDFRVEGIRESRGECVVATTKGPILASNVVACAGIHSDRLARAAGERGVPRIIPFRGDYYTLRPSARSLVNALIYPIPDPRFPFLGVHFTRRIDGEVWAGPNAVLAFAREGYRRRDIAVRDLVETLTYPGFWRLARPFVRMGLEEMWRDAWKPAFVAALQRYVPELRSGDLEFGPSGVRAQAVSRDGSMVDDFEFAGTGRVFHIVNAPSPAATAALAIGRVVAESALSRFGLRASV